MYTVSHLKIRVAFVAVDVEFGHRQRRRSCIARLFRHRKDAVWLQIAALRVGVKGIASNACAFVIFSPFTPGTD